MIDESHELPPVRSSASRMSVKLTPIITSNLSEKEEDITSNGGLPVWTYKSWGAPACHHAMRGPLAFGRYSG